ncbi:glycosyltransferase [Clostridium chrysemydis]|uniref:glycosyltransferase n=1 Tax=Clostridium chrysemydis TaxID=2665504 RepID=UPI003F2DEA44
MKKILIITPYCPYPPHKSGGIHALYNILKENLNKKLDIDLVYFDKKDIDAEVEIKKFVKTLRHIDLRKKGVGVRLESIIKLIPYGVHQYDKSKLIIDKEYDLVIFDQELSIGLVNQIKTKEKRLMAYDSMNLYFKRKAKIEKKNKAKQIYSSLQSFYYKRIHKSEYNKFDSIYYVSDKDTDFEKNMNKKCNSKFETINLGVDYCKFDSTLYKSKVSKKIIFTGIMSYGPNKDAAIWFAETVFPKLLKFDDEIQLIFVGKDSETEIKFLESKNIKVKGFVKDIVEEISNSYIYISPLRYGTGMKNKVLEAMSCSKAIVASEVSVEGIEELRNGENIYIANNEEEWIDKILELVGNDNIVKMFGDRCRNIILNNYSWSKAFDKLFK